jgi:hypothetical protein
MASRSVWPTFMLAPVDLNCENCRCWGLSTGTKRICPVTKVPRPPIRLNHVVPDLAIRPIMSSDYYFKAALLVSTGETERQLHAEMQLLFPNFMPDVPSCGNNEFSSVLLTARRQLWVQFGRHGESVLARFVEHFGPGQWKVLSPAEQGLHAYVCCCCVHDFPDFDWLWGTSSPIGRNMLAKYKREHPRPALLVFPSASCEAPATPEKDRLTRTFTQRCDAAAASVAGFVFSDHLAEMLNRSGRIRAVPPGQAESAESASYTAKPKP